MSLENLLQINENIHSLEDDNYFHSFLSRIENIFSKNIDYREIRKLSSVNKEINQYIDFIDNSNENFFSKKALSRLIKLKNEIYNKTNELVDYKENINEFKTHFINLKKYLHALDLILSDNEGDINLEKCHRNLYLISEIKIKINETSDFCTKYSYVPSKKIVEYCGLINHFIDIELSNKLVDLNLFSDQYKMLEKRTEKDKLYFEEVQNYVKDCSEIIKNTLELSN